MFSCCELRLHSLQLRPATMGAARGGMSDEDSRKLVERVAASRYLSKSARLRDLLVYVCDRVLDGSVSEIHEQEVGHKVFGRPANYDTSSDNIVRVHASMLRKRLEQYFAGEGLHESLIVEIPKGNYAPVFRERDEVPAVSITEPIPTPVHPAGWRVWLLGALTLLFACSTAFLLVRGRPSSAVLDTSRPNVTLFWSQIFHDNRP